MWSWSLAGVAVLLALVTNDYYTSIMLMMIVIQVWQYYLLPDEEQRMPGRKNPMCNTFPRIGEVTITVLVVKTIFLFHDDDYLHTASCNYWRWGSAGVQENINAICILALNHINDKVTFGTTSNIPHLIVIRKCNHSVIILIPPNNNTSFYRWSR